MMPLSYQYNKQSRPKLLATFLTYIHEHYIYNNDTEFTIWISVRFTSHHTRTYSMCKYILPKSEVSIDRQLEKGRWVLGKQRILG
jgi:hypothetical protein